MYSFFLGDIRLPVTPARVDVRYGNKLNRVELVLGREVAFLAAKQLCEIEFSAVLPWAEYPFAVYTEGFRRGDEILTDLLNLKDSRAGGRAGGF
jgi:hypothetical protein